MVPALGWRSSARAPGRTPSPRIRPSNRKGCVAFGLATAGLCDGAGAASCALAAVVGSANTSAIASLDMTMLLLRAGPTRRRQDAISVIVGEKLGASVAPLAACRRRRRAADRMRSHPPSALRTDQASSRRRAPARWSPPGHSQGEHQGGMTVSVRIARGCHRQPRRAGPINGALHDPGRLRVLDELVDIGEPSGVALCDGDPIDVRSIVTFQHA